MQTLLRQMFDAAVAAAQPARVMPPFLPPPPRGRTVVVGAGKAASAMAIALEENWTGPIGGLVVTRYGHAIPRSHGRIAVVEAAHPVPDSAGQAAAQHILELVQGLGPEDLVLCLISGGGSALLVQPPEGIVLADKQAVTQALLKSGASIHEMNTVRKHLSRIKGGRLAAAAFPAQVVTLAISDVPGDDPATIASGPTVADPTTYAEARAILARYRIALPTAIEQWLARASDESPKPGDPRLANSIVHLIARPQASLEAAASIARDAGYEPVLLGDALEGEARQLGAEQAALALARQREGRPLCLLSGGETVVTVRGHGKGGRNAEYLLGLTIALNGAPGIAAIACDTDGIDGSEDNAGAITLSDSVARARAKGIDPAARLADNDAYGFFAALGDLVVTGPTHTNVNDFRAILIAPSNQSG